MDDAKRIQYFESARRSGKWERAMIEIIKKASLTAKPGDLKRQLGEELPGMKARLKKEKDLDKRHALRIKYTELLKLWGDI